MHLPPLDLARWSSPHASSHRAMPAWAAPALLLASALGWVIAVAVCTLAWEMLT